MTTRFPEEVTHSVETNPESLIVDILTPIAEKRDSYPWELPPLNEYVDVDALVRLVETANRGDATHVTTQFRYEEYDVRVQSDDGVEVSLRSADPTVEGRLDD